MKALVRVLVAACAAALITGGCSSASTPQPIPTVVLSGNAGTAGGGVTASGVIVPVQHAELSFPLTGRVTSVPVKVGDHVTRGQTLMQIDLAVLVAEVRVADADLQAEQVAYTYLARSGTDQEHLDSAKADIARAQALLDVKKATLAQATLVAPFDGTVAAVDISPAETVVPGQVVLTLGDLSVFQVETTDLSERDAPRVQVGQQASVDVPALGEQIDGSVVEVARVASTVGGDAVFKVVIQLDSQPQGLLWGMTTTVRIQASN